MKLSHCGPGLTYMPTSASSNCGKRWIIYFHSVNMDDNNEAKKKKKNALFINYYAKIECP